MEVDTWPCPDITNNAFAAADSVTAINAEPTSPLVRSTELSWDTKSDTLPVTCLRGFITAVAEAAPVIEADINSMRLKLASIEAETFTAAPNK